MAAPHVEPAQPSAQPNVATVNRWLIPVGAVAVHICIGSVYAWSTLNRPDSWRYFPVIPRWLTPPYINYTPALVVLGLSAAFGGTWVERRGPRVAATAAAVFFVAGLLIGGIGLALKHSLLVFLGMGVMGGIGCGLGYIAPVSTLVKWFPDRRGMATGMAIMGFGGGRIRIQPAEQTILRQAPRSWAWRIRCSPLAAIDSPPTLIGAWILRRPPAGWKPAGWTPP